MTENDEQRAAEALEIMRRASSGRIETKAEIPSAVLDISGRDVSILFSVDTLDRVGDITSPKAFNRSIGLGVDRIPHLFMHDDKSPAIGRLMTIEPVGRRDLPADVQAEHPEATGGAVAVSRMLKTGRGAEVFEGIREGIPYGASYSYYPKKAIDHPKVKRPDGRPARYLEEVHLLEITTALPGTAINLATRSRLGKALELLAEMKAGARHSASDVELLNQLAALVLSLGATNIIALSDPAQAYPQSGNPPRTSAVDALLADIGSLYEVAG